MNNSMIACLKKTIYELIRVIVPVRIFDRMWSKYFIWATKHRKKAPLSGAYYVKNTCEKDKEYYLCRLSVEAGNGYFAIANRMLFCYEWAVSNGLIPLIDIGYRENFLQEKYDGYNRWEYGFSQKRDIASAFRDGNVLVDSIDSMQFSRVLCKKLNGNSEDIYIHTVKDDNKQYYKILNETSRNVWVFNDSVQHRIQENKERLFNDEKKVMGVVLREEFGMPKEKMSLEQKMIYNDHPRALSLEDTYIMIKKYMEEWKCTHVLIATMFQESVDFFTGCLGEKARFIERGRESFSQFVDTNAQLVKNLISQEKSNERELLNDIGYNEELIRKQTEDYIVEMASIAQCDCCMGVKCSGLIAACIMNGGEFEELLFFDDENNIVRY